MNGEFEKIFTVIEGALVFWDGRHTAGSPVSSDACVACRGGRHHQAMKVISTELILRGVDLDCLAWKINRVCPGSGAYVFDGVLMVPDCTVSMVVLADLASGAGRCA